jgi:hypothetical protein
MSGSDSQAINDHDANTASASPSKDQSDATGTAELEPSEKHASKKSAKIGNADMPPGRSTQTNGTQPSHTKTNRKASGQKRGHIQQDTICRALMEIVEDRSAPASARAAAARTLLDELNRRGSAADRPLSALSIEELEAELKPGEKAG